MNTVTASSTTVLSTSTPLSLSVKLSHRFRRLNFQKEYLPLERRRREKCAPDFVENIYENTKPLREQINKDMRCL